MPVTLEQVRDALAPEELDYNKAARELGEEALPHLERLIATSQPLLASKAVYLAGVIGTEQSVPALERAARSGSAQVRVAAAAAVQHLPAESASDMLLSLVDDADVGVQKTALRSVPAAASAVLRARLEGLSTARSSSPAIRDISREALGRMAQPGGDDAASSSKRAGSKGAAQAGPAGARRGGAKKGGSKKGSAKKGGAKKGGAKKR